MATIDKIVFSQNTPDKKNTLWARPSEKGTELLIFNKGKWGTVGADDFQRFHYEVYSSLEDITEPKPNALYLIGPKGEGEDKYDEYVYTEEGFTKIGDTSIDMSDVIKYSKNSDNSYTLKAEGTEIKKLKTTDDSTIVLGNNNSIGFGASGTINMQSGKISGVKDIQMTFGKIDNVGTISGSSGGLDITASGTAGVNINGITIKSGGTLTFGDGTTMSTAPGTTDYNDLINKPTKVSQFENDANYLTQHQDISGKEDKMPVLNILSGSTSVSCLMGTYYTFEDEINTMNIILPTTQELEPTIHTIVFFMTIGATPAITFNSTLPIYYHDGFGFVAGKTYEVNALFNGSAWVISSVKIIIPTTNNEE